ncbi:aspartate 1-decarboxylase autocleavage activator PanM [Brenneria populi]|uniref:PanD regulatory factor n=1 Tax=Brenneria populi TaxID=1505588 RepID=A0ABU6JSC3_9GAMM|nr:aspartate 1-decarboxylase autocleavage activator PanM [Brenneria populi Li et al. 2015]
MKLTVERLTVFSAQDKMDLSKIWPHQHIELLEKELTEERRLFVARFNDRLLAGVLVEIKGEYAQLNDLMVRVETRRRGVGLYLVEETLRALPGIREWWLVTADHATVNESVLGRFMLSCGFSPVSGGWRYVKNENQ